MNELNQNFKKVVHVFDHDYLTIMMFRKRNWSIFGVDTDDISDIDLVVFSGGEDVSPSLYGEKNVDSYCNPQRDAHETEIFDNFKDIPKVGICRGGQFLNVLSGGRMWQDTDGHGRYHELTDIKTGTPWYVSSTHHQMMRPSEDAEIVAIAHQSDYRKAAIDFEFSGQTDYDDIEVLWYPKTNSLCFQPHPEYTDAEQTEAYFFSLLHRYFGTSGAE